MRWSTCDTGRASSRHRPTKSRPLLLFLLVNPRQLSSPSTLQDCRLLVQHRLSLLVSRLTCPSVGTQIGSMASETTLALTFHRSGGSTRR